MSNSLNGRSGHNADGSTATHLIPFPQAERPEDTSAVPLRSTPWGRELIEHEERKRALLECGAFPAEIG